MVNFCCCFSVATTKRAKVVIVDMFCVVVSICSTSIWRPAATRQPSFFQGFNLENASPSTSGTGTGSGTGVRWLPFPSRAVRVEKRNDGNEKETPEEGKKKSSPGKKELDQEGEIRREK